MITIANKHTYKGEGIYVGRPSVLGNPWSSVKSSIVDRAKLVENPDIAIELYGNWLDEKMKTVNEVSREIFRLVEVYKKEEKLTLICWCFPKNCHANIIAKKIMEIVNEKV